MRPSPQDATVMTVMVVEDSATQRLMASAALRTAGYEIILATDGVEALELLSQHRVDAVVTDVQMPQMDGLTLCRRLRASSADLPVVLLTARGARADVLAGLEAGADAYLTKPYVAEALCERVRDVLESVGQRASERSQPGARADGSRAVSYQRSTLDELHQSVTRESAERKQRVRQQLATARAERARSLLKATLDALPSAIVVVDETGLIIAANKRAETLGELPHGLPTATGVDLLDACRRCDVDRTAGCGRDLAEPLSATTLDGEPRSLRCLRPTHTGPRWFDVHISRFVHDDQVRVILAYIDVHARFEALDRAQASETRFRALAEANPDALLLLSADGTIRDYLAATASPKAAIHGAVVGQKLAAALPPESRHRAASAITQAVAGDGLQTFQFAQSSGGVTRHFEARAVSCGPTEVFATIRDITERHQQEQQLRRRLAFERLIADIAAGLLGPSRGPIRATIDRALDRVGAFLGADFAAIGQSVDSTFVCAGATSMDAERSGQDAINMLSDHLPWLCAAGATRPVMKISGEESLPTEATIDRATWRRWRLGEGLLVSIAGTASSAGVMLVALSDQHTDRHLPTEDEGLVALAGQVLLAALERANSDRALAMSNEQLRHAQRMDAIGRLAGGVAHDFNNLMTIVIGCADLALGDLAQLNADGSSIEDDLKDILTTAKRAATLTGHLLSFSRKRHDEAVTISLRGLIMPSARMLKRVLGDEMSLDVDMQDGHALIKADPSQLGQVLLNLAVNARDATPSGSGTLRFATRQRTITTPMTVPTGVVSPGQYATITVTDDGTGIDPEVAARAFEPFYTTKDVGRGTGLGLSICFGIIRHAGGHIWLESELGEGTTVQIWLPTVAVEQPADDVFVKATLTAASDGEHVLLVDDDPMVRAVAARALRRSGYRLTIAEGGPDAVALLELMDTAPDLLLTDVRMPDINGYQLAETFNHLHPRAAILFMTGFKEHSAPATGPLSNRPTLLKPFGPGGLVDAVQYALGANPAVVME